MRKVTLKMKLPLVIVNGCIEDSFLFAQATLPSNYHQRTIKRKRSRRNSVPISPEWGQLTMLSLTDSNTLNPPLVNSIISFHLIIAMLIARFVDSKLNSDGRTERGGVGGRTPLLSTKCRISTTKYWMAKIEVRVMRQQMTKELTQSLDLILQLARRRR